jgi:predicted RNase H-like HicB family nuclease
MSRGENSRFRRCDDKSLISLFYVLEGHHWTETGLSCQQAHGKTGRTSMTNHSVTLRVTPFLRIACKFWLTDDGWNGSCEQPTIAVHAGSFEHAKSEMEMALGKYIESLLRQAQQTRAEPAA